MISISTIATAIEAARTYALPGREAVAGSATCYLNCGSYNKMSNNKPALEDFIADNDGSFKNMRTGESHDLGYLLRCGYSLLDVLAIPSVSYDIFEANDD